MDMMKHFLSILILSFIATICLASDADKTLSESPSDECDTKYSGKVHRSDYEKRFCNCTGKYMSAIENSLDKKFTTKDETVELKRLTDKRDLLLRTKEVKNQYVKNMRDLLDKSFDKKDSESQIKTYNKSLTSGMLLKSISLALKQNPEALKSSNPFDFLCKSPKDDLTKLCSITGDGMLFGTKNLSDSFNKFAQAYNQIAKGDKNSETDLNKSIQDIISSIPNEIDPVKVFSNYSNFPKLSESGEKYLKCIKKDESTSQLKCQSYKTLSPEDNKLLLDSLKRPITYIKLDNKDPKVSEAFKDAEFSKIENSLQLKITGELSKLNGMISNKDDQSALIEQFSNQVDKLKNEKDFESLINESAKTLNDPEVKNKADNFFAECGSDHKSDLLKNHQKFESCSNQLDNIFSALGDKSIEELNKQIEKKTNAIAQKQNNSDKDVKNKSILKNYLANKYARQCGGFKEPEIIKCKYDTSGNTSEITLMDKSVQKIIGNISGARAVDGSTFSKEEMLDYKKACTNATPEMQEACRILNFDYQMVKDQKTEKEWENFHKDYYVSNGKTYKRKSTAKMVVEAAIPAMLNIVPAWIANMQSEIMIDQLTTQAIWQKQWMADQTAITNFNSTLYFSNLLSTTRSTSTTTSTGTTSYSGYSF
jgi:hypothetical protein